MLVGRIHGFEYVRKSSPHVREMCVGVFSESGNRPWVRGHVDRLLRGTRHLSRKYVSGAVGLIMALWE